MNSRICNRRNGHLIKFEFYGKLGGEMFYKDFVKGTCDDMNKFANRHDSKEEINLFLLRNHLELILDDVKREIKRVGLKETE